MCVIYFVRLVDAHKLQYNVLSGGRFDMTNDVGGLEIVKVGIYLRKSRADDGIQDLEKHKEYLVGICNRNKWMYELYEEIDSSQDIHRKELQRLRKDIEVNKIDAVMVNAVDRLSRRARHFLEIVEDYFLDNNMTILFEREVKHNLLDPTTITMLQMKATLSQAEYSFIVARLNEGRKSSARNGIWSGKIVYGYKYNKDKRGIFPVEDEISVVRKICNMMLQGYTYGYICKELKRFGYKTRSGRDFDVHNIKSIIHSPLTRGHVIVRWGDGEEIVVKNNHEAAMTDSQYEKIKEILKKRREQYKNVAVAPKHFLQGLMKCKKCGLNMSIQANKKPSYPEGTKLYKGYRYYVRKCKTAGCNNYGCNVSMVEDIIIEVLKQYSDQISERIKSLEKINQSEIRRNYDDRVREIKSAISRLDDKEEALLELFIDGGINLTKEQYNKSIEKIKSQKSELLHELNSMNYVNVEEEVKHAENVFDMIKRYELLKEEDKRRLIQLTFSKIEYTRFDKNNLPHLDLIPN